MWAVLEHQVDVPSIMEVRVKLADEGMLQFRVDFYLPLQLLVQSAFLDGFLGDDLDCYFFFTVFGDCAVDYSELARTDLLLYGEVVDSELGVGEG